MKIFHFLPSLQKKRLKWNYHSTVTRGHLRAFAVADHQPDHVRSGLYVETGFDGETGTAQTIVGVVQEFHGDDFFPAGHEIAILIEDGRGDGEIVVVAAISLAEMYALHI